MSSERKHSSLLTKLDEKRLVTVFPHQ